MLYEFSEAISGQNRTWVTPGTVKDEIVNLCINHRVRVDRLPAALQELYGEADARMKGEGGQDYIVAGLQHIIGSSIIELHRATQ
jgi:hypothetical protein